MYAVDLLGLTQVTGTLPNPNDYKTHGKFIAYILNKEFNYSQKDISLAMGTTSTIISTYIREVDMTLRQRSPVVCNNELEKARLLLMMLGYKKLGIDIRNIVY